MGKKKKLMCSYRYDPYVGGEAVWQDIGPDVEIVWGHLFGGYVVNAPRIWMKCPVCGRKLRSSVRLCHDGDGFLHTIPYPHKVKGWYKKKGFHKRKSGKNKRVRYTGRRSKGGRA